MGTNRHTYVPVQPQDVTASKPGIHSVPNEFCFYMFEMRFTEKNKSYFNKF